MRRCRIVFHSALLVVLLAVTLVARDVGAHGRSISYSSWELAAADARVRVRIPLVELSRLPIQPSEVLDGDVVELYLAQHLQLLAGEHPCIPAARPTALAAPTGWGVYTWDVVCSSQPSVAIRSDLLLDVAPSHLHFTRVRFADGTVLEKVLSEAVPRWNLGSPRAAGGGHRAAVGSYIALGIEHILSGWDHLAFVLALILIARTLGEVATLVTGFTVAHSVTLALAVLRLVQPEAIAVEALIGFSIALVAAENAWILAGRDRIVPAVVTLALLALVLPALRGLGALSPFTLFGLALFSLCHFGLLQGVQQPVRFRWAVAFAFGLVHGFGFAGVLAEMDLPTGRLVPVLLGFNLGVEIGQLAVVAALWPALRLLACARQGMWYRAVAEVGSAAVCALGVFWFVSRVFG
jgi:hypothetical protein